MEDQNSLSFFDCQGGLDIRAGNQSPWWGVFGEGFTFQGGICSGIDRELHALDIVLRVVDVDEPVLEQIRPQHVESPSQLCVMLQHPSLCQLRMCSASKDPERGKIRSEFVVVLFLVN